MIELADFASFRAAIGRSRTLRIGVFALAIVAAAAVYLAAPRSTTTPDPLLAKGATTVVVVDVSASISWDTYARIASTLDRVRRSGRRVGLILFSDTAYQALPPGTPAAELAPFERFFIVKQPTRPGFQPQPPRSPWTDAFSAGTRISTGLELALDTIRSNKVRRPRVLLVSDLDDDTTDLESLTSAALAYWHLGIPISVAGLNPSPQDARYMRRLLPSGGALVDVPLSTRPTAEPHHQLPWWPIVLTVALGVALGTAIMVSERLRWAPQ